MTSTNASTNASNIKSAVQSEWYRSLSKYEKPDHRKAIGQLLDTFIPYIAVWALMIWMVKTGVSYWLVLPLIVLAALLSMRIFIFHHDCGHGAFTSSKKANTIIGFITGVLTFTSYEDWRLRHAIHHASSGDLDRRGVGDVWTMTVDEYLNAPRRTRIWYRIFRNPFTLLVIGPPVIFFLLQRFPHARAGKRERKSVLLTNVALVGLMVLAHFTIGLWTYLIIHVPIMMVAGTIGVWMFYVQHQYEDVYWNPHEEWDPIKAALQGSSYYKLPKVFQWFSGNIGLHHIHHLRPRIANYHLQKCYDEVPEMQVENPLTFVKSLECMKFNLWDEKERKMISFRQLPKVRQLRQQTAP